MILSFIAQNRIHFTTRKKTGFPGFLFSATRNPDFKTLPRIGNTSGQQWNSIGCCLSLVDLSATAGLSCKQRY